MQISKQNYLESVSTLTLTLDEFWIECGKWITWITCFWINLREMHYYLFD